MALKRLEPLQGKISLGISIATMDGNNRDEKLYLQNKVSEYAIQELCAGAIKKLGGWFLCVQFLKSLEYPTEAVSLSLKDWNEIVQEPTMMSILLQKCGFASMFLPRTLVWTSKKYQGLGPYYLMLLKQVWVGSVDRAAAMFPRRCSQLSFIAEALRRQAGFPRHMFPTSPRRFYPPRLSRTAD
jgi:hypothetical protein